MKIERILGKTRVERATVLPIVLAAILGIGSFVLHRNGFISSETLSYISRVVTVLQFSVCIPLLVQWKQAKAQEKARQQKENEAAAQAGTYLSGEMTTWK